MKWIDQIKLLVTLIGFLVFGTIVPKVNAQEWDWEILRYNSSIILNEDATVSVAETIVVDFASVEKHGIFRTIPIKFRDRFGNKLTTHLTVVSVDDELGNPRSFQTSQKGGTVEIKIGDPDKTVRGVQTYTIHYSINRVIVRFKTHDEFYWNVTGDEWPVPIEIAQTTVQLPAQPKDVACFTGPSGSSLRNCTAKIAGNLAQFEAASLQPGEGLTIVVAVPKGVLKEPTLSEKVWWFLADNWPYAVPFLTLLLLILVYWQNGRDEQFKSLFDPSLGTERLPLFGTELTPSTYAPLKDLKPAEAGTIIDEEIHIRDIAATIIDLAIRGYLKIEEFKERKIFKNIDYKLHWVKKDITQLSDYESQLILALFGKSENADMVMLSDLKYKFATHLAKIRDSLYDDLVKKGYFLRRPDKVVGTYRAFGVGIAFFGMFFFGQSIPWAVACIASGILIFIAAKTMPRRTGYGRKQYLRVLGLRNFISLGAYREQLWERANLFEEVLPFAIALNLTHKWAEIFEKVSLTQPEWYTGTRAFTANSFAYSMENFTRATTTTLPATYSSSRGGSGFSGGFSGGGFGGGGGGSW